MNQPDYRDGSFSATLANMLMPDNERPYLSLIIPCFNEEKRLPEGLEKAIAYLRKQPYLGEIIIVDDGSTDDTYHIAQELLRNYPHQLIQHKINQGKGAAIRTGVLSSKGKYLVFCDIDMSTPISEISELLTALKSHEVAIGVRRHKNSHVLKHQPWLRENMGQVFTKLTNLLVTPGIVDVTCGFKGFQREAALKLFKSAKIDRWAFDAEILYLARKSGYTIAQIPVAWSDNSSSKVKIIHDAFQSAIDILRIRWLN